MGPTKDFINSAPKADSVLLEHNRSNWVIFQIRLFMSVAACSAHGELEGTDVCLTKPRLSRHISKLD